MASTFLHHWADSWNLSPSWVWCQLGASLAARGEREQSGGKWSILWLWPAWLKLCVMCQKPRGLADLCGCTLPPLTHPKTRGMPARTCSFPGWRVTRQLWREGEPGMLQELTPARPGNELRCRQSSPPRLISKIWIRLWYAVRYKLTSENYSLPSQGCSLFTELFRLQGRFTEGICVASHKEQGCQMSPCHFKGHGRWKKGTGGKDEIQRSSTKQTPELSRVSLKVTVPRISKFCFSSSSQLQNKIQTALISIRELIGVFISLCSSFIGIKILIKYGLLKRTKRFLAGMHRPEVFRRTPFLVK